MADDLDRYKNSKQEVGDWLAGSGGWYVQAVTVLLIVGFIIYLLLSWF